MSRMVPQSVRRLVLAAMAALVVLGASTVGAYQKTESHTVWLKGSIVEFLLPRR